MTLTTQRRTATLQAGENLATFAARVLPEVSIGTAIDQLKAWNLHIFLGRRPVGEIIGSDIVFIEPPLAEMRAEMTAEMTADKTAAATPVAKVGR